MATGYEVVNETIPRWEGTGPETVQVDAPTGKYVVQAYAQGSSGPAGLVGTNSIVTDGQDRITGVVFSRAPYDPPIDNGEDYEAYLVCIDA